MNYAYWLANIPGIGTRRIHRLLRQADSAKELYYMSEKQIFLLDGIGEKEKNSIIESRKRDWEKEYTKLKQQKVQFYSIEDEDYPERLKELVDAPYGIYCKGTLPDETKKQIAIVGARRCSEYGYAMAKELAYRLTMRGACIISGMAKGIDTGAHWGSIVGNGMTAAVFGNGIDVCYPADNRELYQKIPQQGCLLSEYPPGTQPASGLFPARNRIIAGLCDVLLVVEAKKRSGSLITADFALEQGKDIYAVPGRMNDALSEGCNELIRQGAGIISGLEEFIKELELEGLPEAEMEKNKKICLEKEESMVYSCVDLRPKCIEELLRRTGLPMPVLLESIEKLVQKKLLVETFKNYYVRRI